VDSNTNKDRSIQLLDLQSEVNQYMEAQARREQVRRECLSPEELAREDREAAERCAALDAELDDLLCEAGPARFKPTETHASLPGPTHDHVTDEIITGDGSDTVAGAFFAPFVETVPESPAPEHEFTPSDFLKATLRVVSTGVIPAAIDMKPGRNPYDKTPRSDEDRRLELDKKIVDLAWIHKHHRGAIDAHKSNSFAKLFDADEFDCVQANKLVSAEKRSIPAILDYLSIANDFDLQLELCSLRHDKVVRHQNQGRSRKSIAALVHKNEKDKSESNIDHHYTGYLALRLAQGKATKAARLCLFIGGHAKSRDQMNRLKSKLEKWFKAQAGSKASDPWKIR